MRSATRLGLGAGLLLTLLALAAAAAEEDVARLAEFTGELGNVERVEILPFHKMGEYKWGELGLEYKLADTMPPDPELVERVQQQFASRGLYVV